MKSKLLDAAEHHLLGFFIFHLSEGETYFVLYCKHALFKGIVQPKII